MTDCQTGVSGSNGFSMTRSELSEETREERAKTYTDTSQMLYTYGKPVEP